MEAAGPFSQIFFTWVDTFMWTGFRRPLRREDALLLPSHIHPKKVYSKFEALWSAELNTTSVTASTGAKKVPSLFRVLYRLAGFDLCLALILQFGVSVMKLACVIILRRLVQIISAGGDEARTEGIMLALGLALLNFMDTVLSSQATFRLMLCLYGLIGWIAEVVMHKGFRLHPGARCDYRRGDLVNLALSDFSRLVEMAGILMLGISAPFMLVTSFTLMLVLVGPLVLTALITVGLITLVLVRIGKYQGKAFRIKATWQGRRLSILNEMLQSTRFTKFYALEDHYEKKNAGLQEARAFWSETNEVCDVFQLARVSYSAHHNISSGVFPTCGNLWWSSKRI